jgi:hypothetical protein
MADTVEYSILDNITTTLQGVSTANGYNRNIKDATLDTQTFVSQHADAVYIESVEQIKESKLNSVTECTLTVAVVCKAVDGSNLSKAIADLSADVEKALCVDEKRSSNAVSTNIVAVRDRWNSEEDPTEGGCVIEVEILYRHQRGDPYTVRG